MIYQTKKVTFLEITQATLLHLAIKIIEKLKVNIFLQIFGKFDRVGTWNYRVLFPMNN